MVWLEDIARERGVWMLISTMGRLEHGSRRRPQSGSTTVHALGFRGAANFGFIDETLAELEYPVV